MMLPTRRDLLKTASATALYGLMYGRGLHAGAEPLGLPLGLQLYSVREMLPKDYAGTLKQIGAIGYKEVEAAGFYHHSAREVKQAMDDAGLRCVSAHYSSDDLHAQFDQILTFGKELGLSYIICSSPGFKDPARAKDKSSGKVQSFTLDDWRWNAEEFNRMGEKVNAAGMKFGYHNHVMEFRKQNGVVPFDELMRLTDPAKVTIEMDCGWVVVGGGDPVAYLKRYPTRISMLHVKDFKRTDKAASSSSEAPPAAEMGQGTLDYRPIFEAAKGGNIRHVFVEQEEYDMPTMEALRVDAEYMRNLKV